MVLEMQEKFLCLHQSLELDDFTSQANVEAIIRVDEDLDSVTFRAGVLWDQFFL